jgi:microcompartment protein CcmL/EutN
MKNKDSKARMQVIFGVLLFAFVMSTELYAMINYSKMYLVIAGLAVIDLVCLYVVINGLFALREMKDARNEEQYDSVFKSEKASYLMLKKYFEEIEDKLNYLEKAAKVPTEEIVNAQKGIAKVIINRNRENTEALINSNEQVMEQFTECSSTIADITKLLSAYKDEIVSEQKKTEEVNEQSIQVKMQDLLIQMKDMELRLNQAINQIQNVNYQQPMVAPTYIQQPQVNVAQPEEKPVENVQPAIKAAEKVESEIPVVAEDTIPKMDEPLEAEAVSEPDLGVDMSVLENSDEVGSLDVASDMGGLDVPDSLDVDASGLDIPDDLNPDAVDLAAAEDALADLEIPEVNEEPVVEEKPPMPDLSDPNKKMSPDEIAALFANMSGDAPKEEVKEEPKPVEPEPAVEEPAAEEKPPMPDLSDPNKTMSPDEIAALFANMSDDAPKQEDKPVEPEPIVEEPAAEEKPPMPDLSDPNKTLSPDEIAALFANMQ